MNESLKLDPVLSEITLRHLERQQNRIRDKRLSHEALREAALKGFPTGRFYHGAKLNDETTAEEDRLAEMRRHRRRPDWACMDPALSGADWPAMYLQEWACSPEEENENMKEINEAAIRQIAYDYRKDLQRGSLEYNIDIEVDSSSKKISALSEVFCMHPSEVFRLLRDLSESSLQQVGQDGKPFDLIPHRMRTQRNGARATLGTVQVNPSETPDRPEWVGGSMADRVIEARYFVYYDRAFTSEVRLIFPENFFRRQEAPTYQGNWGVIDEHTKIERKEKTMNKSNEILNLIDESFTTIRVSFDGRELIQDKKQRKKLAKDLRTCAMYTYKVPKNHNIKRGDYVVVEARGILKTAMVLETHEESKIDDNRAYNWVVDVINIKGIKACKKRDAEILAEINEKEKAKQKEELREHMTKRLGIESISDVKALGYDVEAEGHDAAEAYDAAEEADPCRDC